MKRLMLLMILCLAQGALAMEDVSLQLTRAAGSGDLARVQELLNHADVNGKDRYGITPLVKASSNGQSAIVKLLLEQGADPNLAVQLDFTPLMAASSNGNQDVVKFLLESNADLTARGGGNLESPLMWAAKAGHIHLLKLLLAAISNEDKQIIRNYFEGLLAIQRMRFESSRSGWRVEQSKEPLPAMRIDELKKVRQLITQQVLNEYINKYISRAILLMNQKNCKDRTASQLAAINKYHAIAILLDPNNQESREEIRQWIEANVRRALFAKPEGKE